MPTAALTSLLPLMHGAALQPGETVLVNGATGVSGKLAVQIARLLGAGRIVGTGRSPGGLASLPELGADATIDLKAPDHAVARAFEREAGQGCDVVLDFLWGRPAELLLGAFVPKEAGFARRRVRYVQIGEAAGATISLAAAMLRTSGVELVGVGSPPLELVQQALERAWSWARGGSLRMDVEEVPLRDVSRAWQRSTDGSRIVIVP